MCCLIVSKAAEGDTQLSSSSDGKKGTETENKSSVANGGEKKTSDKKEGDSDPLSATKSKTKAPKQIKKTKKKRVKKEKEPLIFQPKANAKGYRLKVRRRPLADGQTDRQSASA